ncbi:MAG: hypothetical protein AAF611_09065 [Bacteroidota bacterium]
MTKLKCFCICFFSAMMLYANMASPVQEGTLGTRPFISQYVHILHENLYITLHADFTTAQFEIEYIINAEKDGLQIPLLFYASEYYKDFQVTIDGQEIALQKQEYFWDVYGDDKEKLSNFEYLYNTDAKKSRTLENQFKYERNDRISLNDFLYFETDIAAGKHSIKVSYQATNWRYSHNRLNEDSFRYALAPAKYWKSFGILAITIDASKVQDKITINLGTPKSGEVDEISNYHFEKLPVDMIQITRIPTLSGFAKFLLNLETFWLAIILISFFIVFHVWKMHRFRKQYPFKPRSNTAILGTFIMPLLFVCMLLVSTFWIDEAIGKPYASGRESYGAFYEFLNLPKYVIVYIVFAILVDFMFKKRYIQR